MPGCGRGRGRRDSRHRCRAELHFNLGPELRFDLRPQLLLQLPAQDALVLGALPLVLRAHASLYILPQLEPCCFTGLTGPCCEAIVEAGVERVVVGAIDPNPRVAGNGLERLREAGLQVDVAEGELAFRARRQNEAWRTWIALGRPFVTYKVAATLDGRVTLPGSRWLSGDDARRLVHELRAASDAVAVGMGTVLADSPRLDAREVEAARQPRRLAFGKGPLPAGSELELRSGPLAEELAALGEEGVQSLLLEGGPTLATAFVEAGLVDKLLVFVTPHLAGTGSRLLSDLSAPLELSRVSAEAVGEDVLISAYVHEP